MMISAEWWKLFTDIVTQIWEIASMLVDIISVILLVITFALTIFIRIAIWIPGPQPEKFLMSVREYLTKFIDRISILSRRKKI